MVGLDETGVDEREGGSVPKPLPVENPVVPPELGQAPHCGGGRPL
eukprot:COSAG01_NODE_113_length_25617_cov_10.523492_26_plen_45_part_00